MAFDLASWIMRGKGRSCCFYYDRLNDPLAVTIYQSMLGTLARFEKSFVLPVAVSERSLNKILDYIVYDHPKIFYSGGYVAEINRRADTTVIIPEYSMEKQKVCELAERMDTLIESLAGKWSGLPSDEAKERAVHDYLCTHVKYSGHLGKLSHTAAAPLLYGYGVCDGIAKAAKLFFDRLEIDNFLRTGYLRPEEEILPDAQPAEGSFPIAQDRAVFEDHPGKKPEPEDMEDAAEEDGHCWNFVRIYGAFYHLDITNDLCNDDEARKKPHYAYFNLTDEQIKKDVSPDIEAKSGCAPVDYFSGHLRSFSSVTRFKAAFARAASQKKKSYAFRIRGNGKMAEELQKYDKAVGEILYIPELNIREIQTRWNLGQGVMELTIKYNECDE